MLAMRPNTCTDYSEIHVPLKLKSSGYAAGKATVSLTASTSPGVGGKPLVDSDTLKLVCMP